jgi:CBS domain-containing protein
MKARDVMTSKVVSVPAETPTRDIARLLLDNHVSAVPVLDGTGAAIGMVSEGDLIGRTEAEREARHDWWLALLAEGEPLNAEFLSSLRRPERTAGEVMSRPVVTARTPIRARSRASSRPTGSNACRSCGTARWSGS